MLIFVYGTLKKGERSAGKLRREKFITRAITRPLYRLYDMGSYPGMVFVGTGGLCIEGEIYEVSDYTLKCLDSFEGTQRGIYKREKIQIQEPSDINCEGYLWLLSVDNLAECGTNWQDNFLYNANNEGRMM